uniref:Uncharacterized protein n=1 Tax=Siphoviridae sp. ctHip2 TaxID=2827830 RepID=A0A8S5RWH9_9CAUD|nr:MAG TPA: hypothetical protein [Siphoviridae sp. ctHip2]
MLLYNYNLFSRLITDRGRFRVLTRERTHEQGNG